MKQRHLTLFQRFILYLMALSILPLLLLGAISYQISRSTVSGLSDRFVAEVLDGRRDQLELQVEQVESLLSNISGVEGIIDALREAPDSGDTYTRLATQARIGYILNGYLNIDGLVSIDLLAADGRHFHVGETLDFAIGDEARGEQILAHAAASDRPVHRFGVVESLNANSDHRRVISAAKVVWDVDRESVSRFPMAVVVVNYSLDYLRQQFAGIDLGQGAALMVIDGAGRFLYHPDQARVGEPAPDGLIAAMRPQGLRGEATLDGVDMVVRSVPIDRTDWRMASAIPMRTLSAPTALIGAATILGLLLCLTVVAGAAALYSSRVVSPIRAVTERFRAARDRPGQPVEALPVRGHDEIAELAAGFNAFMQAVAERRASEEALRVSEERFSLAMQGANDGLWDWDIRHDRLYLSPRWRRMLGLERAAGEGDGNGDGDGAGSPALWLDRIHPDDRRQVEEGMQAHLAGRAAHFESEHRVRHADGSWVWFLARGLAVRGADGRPHRMAGSCTDITARKEAAEDLIRARDSAEAANRAKSEFLAMMSHELRTPLNAILGFTEIMTAETFGALGSPRYRQYLLDIKASGERLLGNINTILDLSKIDSGNMDLHDDLILPGDLTALPLRLLAGMAQKNGVALTGEIPEDVPAIRGDARLMEQALTNLLSNAIKASHRGGAVTLSAGCGEDGGVVLRVADEGVGMSAEDIEIALTPFGQVSTGHARRHEGTGLGLPLTQRIVEKHGGRLVIDSTPGAGTTIAIHLPAERVVALPAPTEARRATA